MINSKHFLQLLLLAQTPCAIALASANNADDSVDPSCTAKVSPDMTTGSSDSAGNGNVAQNETNPDGDDAPDMNAGLPPYTLDLMEEATSWSGARATDPDAIFSAPGDDYRPPPYSEVWELSDFIAPPLRPGEIKNLRWNDDWFEDKRSVQNYAARVGLPKHTLAVLRKYASDLGMLEEMHKSHYEYPLEPESGRFHVTPAVHSSGHPLKWYIQRPGTHFDSDMHWFGSADERTHESFIRVLAEAGIDLVFDAIAEEYELDSLAIQGVGFLSTSHANVGGFMHADWRETGGKAFNILIPLEQVPGAGPEMYVADDEGTRGEIKLHPNFGLIQGDASLHGTHECDHRPSGKIRSSVYIYIADLTHYNIDIVGADSTAIFPLPESVRWLWSQRGRHWNRDGASLVDDIGRGTFTPVDLWSKEVCNEKKERGLCELDDPLETLLEIRTNCAATCNVFIPDEEYQLGAPRREVFY